PSAAGCWWRRASCRSTPRRPPARWTRRRRSIGRTALLRRILRSAMRTKTRADASRSPRSFVLPDPLHTQLLRRVFGENGTANEDLSTVLLNFDFRNGQIPPLFGSFRHPDDGLFPFGVKSLGWHGDAPFGALARPEFEDNGVALAREIVSQITASNARLVQGTQNVPSVSHLFVLPYQSITYSHVIQLH